MGKHSNFIQHMYILDSILIELEKRGRTEFPYEIKHFPVYFVPTDNQWKKVFYKAKNKFPEIMEDYDIAYHIQLKYKEGRVSYIENVHGDKIRIENVEEIAIDTEQLSKDDIDQLQTITNYICDRLEKL